MKRSHITLQDIASRDSLALGWHRAAKAARHPTVTPEFGDLFGRLQFELLNNTWQPGPLQAFRIRDPKPRWIHAPCFRDRVLHHALMAHVGPVLDRCLIDDTFACRTEKGTLAAVQRVQHLARRAEWYVQVDVRHYFACIEHDVLNRLLQRKFRNPALLDLLERIIGAHQTAPGKGLPIGALSSQHLANYYLAGLDRLIADDPRSNGVVRYMDDIIGFGAERSDMRSLLSHAKRYAEVERGLEFKTPIRIGRCRDGIHFCGHRIQPGLLLLSRRRKRRYVLGRRKWERLYNDGLIDGLQLQRAMASINGLLVNTDAARWRAEQLRRSPVAGNAKQL